MVQMEKEIIFEAKHMRKEFGPTIALKDVDFTLRRGEIRGLVGENGSGKSTIMSIASGMQPATSGEMFYKGQPWKPGTMVEAQDAGISMILQEANTIPGVTVAQNIFSGHEAEFSTLGVISMAKMKKDFYMIAPDEMKVLEQNARVFQEILETRPEDRTGILLARGHLDDAFNCGITVYGEELNYDNFSVMLTQLRQWYFDNPKRKAAHQEFLLRSREYMYQPLNLEGNNTCEFELSPETLRLIEIRTEIKKQKEARKAVNNS